MLAQIIFIIEKKKSILKKFKEQNRFSDTSGIPESALPELKPLPNLITLEENKDHK